MKFFTTKFIAVFLFLVCAINAKAVNDSLTIGQAFDLKVGDSLVYADFISIGIPPPGGPIFQYGTKSISVAARTNLSDTIVYDMVVNSNHYLLSISQLDSPVTKFSYSILYPVFGGCEHLSEMPTCDSSWANCDLNTQPFPSAIDTFESLRIRYPQFETGWEMTFTEKVGLRYADYNALEFYPNWPLYSGGCGMRLIYFQSDSLIWMDDDYYTNIQEISSPSFHLFPNPATDELTVTFEGGNSSSFDAYIYDIMGNCVLAHKNISDKAADINVRSLPPGYYVLKLTDEHSLSASKGFIIAR